MACIQKERNCPLYAIKELVVDILSEYDSVAISAISRSDSVILWGIKIRLPDRYEYVNINEELVTYKVATTRIRFDTINEKINDLVNKNRNQYQMKDVKRWLPSRSISKVEFIGYVQHITQQMCFWVLEEDRKKIADEIQSGLEQIQLDVKDSIDWEECDACFAPFHTNGKYYRATIRYINVDLNSCMVCISSNRYSSI